MTPPPAPARPGLWTRPFAAWVAPARPGWRLSSTILVVILAEVGFALGAVVLLDPAADGPWPLRGLMAHLAFAAFAAATVLAARHLHGRAPRDLLGRLDPEAFRVGVGAAVLAGGLPILLWGWPPGAEASLPPAAWALWLLPALLALGVQTGAEEVFFRGYLQTQLAARFDAPWVWMALPSAYFALLHVDTARLLETGALPPEQWEYLLWAFAFGLFAADLARVTGGLAAPWGWHLGVNVWPALILGAPEGGDLALYVLPHGAGAAKAAWNPLLTTVEILVLTIGWATVRLWLAGRPEPA